jgi:hypothetical protein
MAIHTFNQGAMIGGRPCQTLADAAIALRQYAISHKNWSCWRLAREMREADSLLQAKKAERNNQSSSLREKGRRMIRCA